MFYENAIVLLIRVLLLFFFINCLPLMIIDTLWLVTIWVFTHLYKPHLISWIASKNYFIRNLCHCSVFGDVCPRGCFLSKLTSVVRWHVFPFMTWEIMAGCQLISLAEKELTTSANCLGKQRHGVLWGCNWVKKLVRLIKKPV